MIHTLSSPAFEKYAQQSDQYQMRRIINVKEFAHAFPHAAFAVIAIQDRNTERCAELQRAVKRIKKNHIYCGIHGSPYHQPHHLSFEIAAIRTDK